MITVAEALTALEAEADAAKAEEMAAYHKAPRRYLGVTVPQIEVHVATWRAEIGVEDRTALAGALWETDVHEARVAAAKLLTQARMRPDEGAWNLIAGWAQGFDAWALADHATIAGQKRVVADPSRLDQVEGWTQSPNMWTRRAALVITLPWAKLNNPKAADLEIRERVLTWAEGYVPDRDWFMQKVVAWWLRDLSKRAPERTAAFLQGPGAGLKAFARKEAAQYLPPEATTEATQAPEAAETTEE
jgi:3-methyladenine DNA glycosylase AlkD